MSYSELSNDELKDTLEELVEARLKAKQYQMNLTQQIKSVAEVLRRRGFDIDLREYEKQF